MHAGGARHAGAGIHPAGGGIHPAMLLRAAVIIPALVAAVALSAFAWSAARLAPRGVPVGVAGTAKVADAVGHRLDGLGGKFDAHTYGSEAAAVAAIRHREIYGAFVAGPGGLTVLTAPAASPAVATLLTKVGEEAGQHAAAGRAVPVRVVDVVPADPNDPQGIVLDSAFLPLVIIGSLGGVMTWVAGRDGRRAGYPQAGVLLVKSALIGLVVVGIVQGWLGVIPGDWVANAAVIGLTVIAISSTVCGLGATARRARRGARRAADGVRRQPVLRCVLRAAAAAEPGRDARPAPSPGCRRQPAAQLGVLRRLRIRCPPGRACDMGGLRADRGDG